MSLFRRRSLTPGHSRALATGDAPPLEHEQDHILLRELRDVLVDAINRGDLDAIDANVHPDVVITWQNNVVCRGREELREFYRAMVAKAGKRDFKGYKIPPTADDLTLLYSHATTGVVYGYNVGRFFLAGREIEMPNRWTATVVKEEGRWWLAAYHVSMNVVDNPMLTGIKAAAVGAAAVALIAGVAVGWIFGGRSRPPVD